MEEPERPLGCLEGRAQSVKCRKNARNNGNFLALICHLADPGDRLVWGYLCSRVWKWLSKALLTRGMKVHPRAKGHDVLCLKQELQNTNAVLLLAEKPSGRMSFPPFPLSVNFSTG